MKQRLKLLSKILGVSKKESLKDDERLLESRASIPLPPYSHVYNLLHPKNPDEAIKRAKVSIELFKIRSRR